jgi:hypothetical protein
LIRGVSIPPAPLDKGGVHEQKTGFSEKPLFYSCHLNFLKKKIDPPSGGKKRKREKG